jgi:hypothetical protein
MTKITGALHEELRTFKLIFSSIVASRICRKNQNTRFTFNFFSEILTFHNVEKYCTARQATDDNTAHVFCMLDN